MVQIPAELKYTNDHEWVMEEGDMLVIGVSDYAQDSLGEIVYIELPSEGDEITKGDPFGAVESTKAVSDLYAPNNSRSPSNPQARPGHIVSL